MRYTFALASRRINSPSLAQDLVQNLRAWAFPPDRPTEVVVGLCPAGLREVMLLDYPQLRRLLWERAGLNPSAQLRFVSHAELKEHIW